MKVGFLRDVPMSALPLMLHLPTFVPHLESHELVYQEYPCDLCLPTKELFLNQNLDYSLQVLYQWAMVMLYLLEGESCDPLIGPEDDWSIGI